MCLLGSGEAAEERGTDAVVVVEPSVQVLPCRISFHERDYACGHENPRSGFFSALQDDELIAVSWEVGILFAIGRGVRH